MTSDGRSKTASWHSQPGWRQLRDRRFGRPQFERALRYPSQRRLVLRFGVGLLLGLAALVGVGYVIGHGPSGSSGGLLHALTAAAGRPAVSAFLAVPPALLCAWCLRRLWLQYLGWLPGTIHVPEFSYAAETTGAMPAQLTTQFRNCLATLRLQTASPAPGAEPPSDFLDVLSNFSLSDGSSVAQIVSLLRVAFPPRAIEVRGTLLERKHASECFGVSLQVARLPDQGSLLEDVWDISWERAIRRAADGAIAAILPRTRLCKGPWEPWRGYVMPPELFGACEHASRLDSERRYYAALESCYRALALDPFNRGVRLQLGKLQEQLGLFLDALSIYQSVLVTGLPAGGPLPRRLYSRRARTERARQSHIAHYRKIVLISGHSIVDQWKQVRRLPRSNSHRRDMEKLLLEVCATPPDLKRCTGRELRRALCITAYDEATELRHVLRWWRIKHPFRKPHLLPRTVAMTRASIAECSKVIERSREHDRAPAIDERLRHMDERVRRCARFTGLRSWQGHYNAACLYAIPLSDERDQYDKSARQRFAERSVEQLQLATSFADSAFVASRRDWLISEDPDLGGLRKEPEFTRLVSMYFPTHATTHLRPAEPAELSTRHTYELLRSIAACWGATWKLRASAVDDAMARHALPDWWHDDSLAWSMIADVSACPADWRAHLALVSARRSWGLRYSVEFSEPQFHRFATDTTEGERIAARLAALRPVLLMHQDIGPTSGDPAHDIPAWLLDREDGLPDDYVAEKCEGRAALWAALHTFLGIDHEENEARLATLTEALRDMREGDRSIAR